MKYKEKYTQESQLVSERMELMEERLQGILAEESVPELFRDYFSKQASLLLSLCRFYQMAKSGELEKRDMAECQTDNELLYGDIRPENYENCYGNPDYACQIFGQELGNILSCLYRLIRTGIGYAFEEKQYLLTIVMELFVSIYNLFEVDDIARIDAKEITKTIYWHYYDYSDVYDTASILEMIDPDFDFYTSLILNANLNDLTYLYRYGLPIGDNELGIAEFLNQMSEEEIQAMADTYTEGYRIGFAATNKDISKKKTVNIHCPVGFERMIRAAIKNFEAIGLKTTIYRAPSGMARGLYSSPVNRQYDFDHREDRSLWFEKALVERRLEVRRTTLENHKDLAAVYGGPAVVEVFGESPFAPENKEHNLAYSEKQQQLNVYEMSMNGQLTNEYIPRDEYSFTIIAYPLPEIGDQFAEIFAKTVEINTLDYELYQKMQQAIIDVLDGSEYVHILGQGDNRTDLKVAIHPLLDPKTETAFENCVADVNIPVGEVFTSPILTGTNGVLHVSEVFLNGLKYVDLEMVFKDGMIESYSCGNFEDQEKGRKYIKDNVLMHHDTLPMGEFAIGTNTTAYRMGKDYNINDKLPILIAEKTGPHFAVGDTCYSHSEDVAQYNPNGKEVVARENEVSALRKEDMSKAYFNCHTDITIPYAELGSITAVYPDGSRADIIRDGRFVVAGTEELNKPLEGIKEN